MSQEENWNSYLWPSNAGPGEVMLVNLYGLHDPEELARREYSETALRALELQLGKVEIPSTGDLAEWQAVHSHLFGNVYSWAGELRTVSFTRHDGHYFLHPQHFAEVIPQVFDAVADLDWADMTRYQFADNAARLYTLLNWVHPFREGNGRSTRLFLDRQIAAAPYMLDYTRVGAQRWETAAMASRPTKYTWPTNHRPVLAVFNEIASRRDRSPTELDPLDPLDLQQIIDNARQSVTSGHATGAAIDAAGLNPQQIIDSSPTDLGVADEERASTVDSSTELDAGP